MERKSTMEQAENMEAHNPIIVDVLQQKLLEKNEEEESVTKACEELQLDFDGISTKKVELFENLVKTLVVYPRGQVAINYMLKETVARCDTLSKYVVDKLKLPEPEEPIALTPKDDFTMMSYVELSNETKKTNKKNEQRKSELKALTLDAKEKIQIIDLKHKEIDEEENNFAQYLNEMRKVQKELEFELDPQNVNKNSSGIEVHTRNQTGNLTLDGWEQRINELYEKNI